ncbi:L,D-transpeptidase [Pseudoxanthomonas suwonensis]|uniref:ErfK-YbiS-YcfS-YnhG family protein n=1 Tax=Pseudoxanthomonas suwonensis TaxID=314722 RepID=A0A0E3UNR9_9GAMM|nr:L,D-transpeptidase [Pseudoxanthomonas suwonensis]AKC87195.1 ErfK-YbiS-YcfS-YnhG family protein [Pseudoxanthomonas suwonensis]
MIRLLFIVLLGCLAQAFPAHAVPSWGAGQSSSADTPPSQLKPGEWVWGGDSKAMGPMAVIVSLTEQRAYVYRNGILIAFSTVSTGKPGHETPTGVFTILQKDKDHHSSKYNNAPMPYQERLTWDGVALHAGGLPGYPESHGCVHLPSEFARLLFESTTLGMTVVIARQGKSPDALVHPVAASPINPMTGAESGNLALAGDEQFRWHPELAPAGPVSMVMSTADLRLFVYRNGVEIGRSRIAFRQPGAAPGTHAYMVAAGGAPGAMPPWIRIGIPGHEADAGVPVTGADIARVVVPTQFVENMLPLLTPGSVLVETDEHVLPATTGPRLQVINSDPPAL